MAKNQPTGRDFLVNRVHHSPIIKVTPVGSQLPVDQSDFAKLLRKMMRTRALDQSDHRGFADQSGRLNDRHA